MTFKSIFLALLFTGKAFAGSEYIIIDESVRAAYEAKSTVYQKARPTLVFDNGNSVNNCEEYLRQSNNASILETVDNTLVKSSYLVCDAIDIITQSKVYEHSPTLDQFGSQLFEKLDLRSFPNSVARLFRNDEFSIKHLNRSGSFVGKTESGFDNENSFFRVKVVAVILANDNQQPDWVVQFADESNSGNYGSYGTFILLDPEKKDVLTASEIR